MFQLLFISLCKLTRIILRLKLPIDEKLNPFIFIYIVHSPASVEQINATLSNFSMHLSWTIPKAKASSYTTHFIIYLNRIRIHRISRVKYGNEFVLRGLKPYTEYTVGIQAQDGFLKNSTIVYEVFRTKKAGTSFTGTNHYHMKHFYSIKSQILFDHC
jgi:hypothetical protein